MPEILIEGIFFLARKHVYKLVESYEQKKQKISHKRNVLELQNLNLILLLVKPVGLNPEAEVFTSQQTPIIATDNKVMIINITADPVPPTAQHT
ncbi:hypothetical protein RclHR1_16590003 [Rhizophagus clarus]|uniref:Uncharacterized protein n=1 Tax=Rhizophagus clarus TaxID=94130 RepID=A0A2Z6QHY1_9GLOM|nr:hypothetical protein RclHR1_16590003 [Rhizophagus clarus]GES79259.1 hypothetical protein RCL_jg6270.t1 [Rhizophagus clarus]